MSEFALPDVRRPRSNLASSIAYSPLIVSYTVEILPYSLRAKGFNVFNFSVSVSIIFNQYVNPIALGKIGWKYYIVYVAWLCVELVFIWLYAVETKGRSLEETAAMFDGEDAVKELENRAAHDAVADEKLSDGKQEEFVHRA